MKFVVEQLNLLRDEVIRIGEAETLDDAISIAKRTIDEFLDRHKYYHASPDALYTRYQESGCIPCIFRNDGDTLNVSNFDHFGYASLQCLKVCKPKK